MDTLHPAQPKTPADFEKEADTMNAAFQTLATERADLERRAGEMLKKRETLIGAAGTFGVTAKFARVLLRKG